MGPWKSSREFTACDFFLQLNFFVRLECPFLRPDPQCPNAVARRVCQGWRSLRYLLMLSAMPGHTLTNPSTAARSLWSGWTGRGELACRARTLILQPCIRWARNDPGPLCSLAHRQRKLRGAGTHSAQRHESHGFFGPRHLESSSAILILVRIEPKPSSYWRPIFNSSCSLRRGAWRHPPGPRPPAPAATTRSVACGPVPQSWSCGLWANAPFAADTIAPERCPSGTAGTATPIGSCHGAHGRCPIVPSLSRGS